MKRPLFIIIVLSLFNGVYAQQDYQITHYMFDNLSFNPGYAGMNNNICGTMITREQWTGFSGNPSTKLLNVHSPIEMLRGGLGFSYINDQLGFESNNIARLSYSYHMGLGAGKLGIGLSAGILQKSFNATWITPEQGSSYVHGDDNSIPLDNASGISPDINLGVFYKTEELYLGIIPSARSQCDFITFIFFTSPITSSVIFHLLNLML